MDRKDECYRLTHPLSKIFGYATGATFKYDGPEVKDVALGRTTVHHLYTVVFYNLYRILIPGKQVNCEIVVLLISTFLMWIDE